MAADLKAGPRPINALEGYALPGSNVKLDLMQSLEPGEMTIGNKSKRPEVPELLRALEPLNPTTDPAYSERLKGSWVLKYDDTGDKVPALLDDVLGFTACHPGRSLKGLITTKGATVTIADDLSISSAAIVVLPDEREVESNGFESRLLPETPLFIRLLPEAPTPRSKPSKRRFLVSYVDDDLMVLRDENGKPTIFIRKPLEDAIESPDQRPMFPAEAALGEAAGGAEATGQSAVNLDDLIIHGKLGVGTQGVVLLGKFPGDIGLVAVKRGLKVNAIAREAAVLSFMSGVPGFPTVVHHEPVGPHAPGGLLITELLGPSLDQLLKNRSSEQQRYLSGEMLLRVGRGILRRLRQLHLAGFVHNDIKPSNVLLGARSSSQPAQLHLIDFGSVTRAVDFPALENLPHVAPGAIGTVLFASVAADDGCNRPLRPADDIEGLVYVLSYLATGTLPWDGKKPEALATGIKANLLANSTSAAELTGDLECAETAAALDELWAQVRRCHADDSPTVDEVDYNACLAALGGKSFEEDAEAEAADALSEFSIMAALGGKPTISIRKPVEDAIESLDQWPNATRN